MIGEKNVLIVSEVTGQSGIESLWDLISEGRRLADNLGEQLAVLLIGDLATVTSDQLSKQGVDLLYQSDFSSIGAYNTSNAETYAVITANLIQQQKPKVVITSNNLTGQELASRLAAKLKAGAAIDCVSWETSENKNITLIKPVYGDRLYSHVSFNSRPWIFTLRSGSANRNSSGTMRRIQSIEFKPEIKTEAQRVKVLEHFKVTGDNVPLTEADIIVSGGLGIGNKENWKLVQGLAKSLGGTVGASQGAVDAGWAPREKQIGLSGKVVAPKLYIACGISGATHHIMGIKDTQNIIAINRDRGAPIFKIADICILGDIREVLPSLIQELTQTSKPNPTL